MTFRHFSFLRCTFSIPPYERSTRRRRMGERIGITVMSLFAGIIPDKYKPMPYDTLAKALLGASMIRTGGTYTYRKILDLAGG